MVADDFDGDGKLDVLVNGNDYSTTVSIGRFDALNGLLLKGNGKGGFSPFSILKSGIYIPGNGKVLVKLLSAKADYLIAASQRNGLVKMFQLNHKLNTFPVQPSDNYAIIKCKTVQSKKEIVLWHIIFVPVCQVYNYQ